MTFEVDGTGLAKARLFTMRHARRVPGMEQLLRSQRRAARARHVPRLPQVADCWRGHFEVLSHAGLVRTELAALGLDAERAMGAAEMHLGSLARGRGELNGTTSLHVPLQELVTTPELFLLGLSEPLLSFAERYLGLPVDYLGVDVRRELANGAETGVRLWHFDVEDDRMLKVIVYLNEVDEASGPFEAILAPRARRFRQDTRYVWGDHYTHHQVELHVPRSEWYRGLGPLHAVHLFDPVQVLHRAAPPTRRDRYTVTFSYASKAAYFAFSSARIAQRTFAARWGHLFTPRQRECVVSPALA